MTAVPTGERAPGARRRSLLLAVAAFALYGGWAFVANRSYGTAAGVTALLTQGTASFLSTFTITMVMEVVHGASGAPLVRVARSFLAGCAVMYALTLGLHLIMGTPELAVTVAPVLGFGTLYCAAYSFGLGKLRRPAESTQTG